MLLLLYGVAVLPGRVLLGVALALFVGAFWAGRTRTAATPCRARDHPRLPDPPHAPARRGYSFSVTSPGNSCDFLLRRHGARRRLSCCANPAARRSWRRPRRAAPWRRSTPAGCWGTTSGCWSSAPIPTTRTPDLITVLVRGEGAEAAYLSLNRGEGGQNLIGPELGEALGLLRTEELLSARSLDGGRQYFTRAYDFGYSKTLDDTWQHWPRDSILKDVVRVIRHSSRRSSSRSSPARRSDGHGQHQAAGWAAQRGLRGGRRLAALPGTGARGRTAGLARRQALSRRRDSRRRPNMFTIQTGGLDPAVGQSYHQIAMASRSRHRSQDMGALQTPGPASTRIALVTDRTGAGDSLWAGIDTTLSARTSEASPLGGPGGSAVIPLRGARQ